MTDPVFYDDQVPVDKAERDAIKHAAEHLITGDGPLCVDDLAALVRLIRKLDDLPLHARLSEALISGQAAATSDSEALTWWAGVQRDAIMQAWDELPDGTLNAVQAVADRLHLHPTQVRAVVYPTGGPL